jgi:hypothetical protein
MISRNRSAPTAAAISIECTTSANKTVTCLYSAGFRPVETAAPQWLQNLAFSLSSVPQDPHESSVAVISRGSPAAAHINIVSPLDNQRASFVAAADRRARFTLLALAIVTTAWWILSAVEHRVERNDAEMAPVTHLRPTLTDQRGLEKTSAHMSWRGPSAA